jgi:hypothetical protein
VPAGLQNVVDGPVFFRPQSIERMLRFLSERDKREQQNAEQHGETQRKRSSQGSLQNKGAVL